ncbi:AbrB/MazE/SpoVT family DNA-binding domain-containing protein [Desulfofundulus sp. TPOSR]|uniref:AbrB/MazE/SpoVT family DNA-binding domain-containing protein n=1 Tax=Desulfofundulus sp. TPOSR TaxID=2714340 RepID=UPI00140E1067|nr:AbrB/MazE/SpoVT family DNA-binding domain-containing protein [Desulfofundulus sp. TPOSR]NHM27258.1 AbrB/MazE/SpoVT family DNA-binding domain-containing protein [Desulfofundulus sp. TPOSR]
MNLIRIRPKGQITLPLPVRKAVQADAGDYLVCEVRGDSVILRKAPVYPRASFDDGIWRLVGSAEDKEKIRPGDSKVRAFFKPVRRFFAPPGLS